MTIIEQFHTDAEIQWCPGCPNNLMLKALKAALAQSEIPPSRLCLVSGIGQAAKTPHYVKCNFFNGLHGRALPAALGINAVNPELKTIVTTGEGDCYGEGGNHFLHALRRNPDITLIVHDNTFYALTKGQASPTTPLGEARSLNPGGVTTPPLNVLGLAIVQNCGFVARGFALDAEQLTALIVEGIKHRGLSLIDVVQPCITWSKRPVDWYRQRIAHLPPDHDPFDRAKALAVSEEEGKLSTGVVFRAPPRLAFGDDFRDAGGGVLYGTRFPPLGDFASVMESFRKG